MEQVIELSGIIFNFLSQLWDIAVFLLNLPFMIGAQMDKVASVLPLSYHLKSGIIPAILASMGILILYIRFENPLTNLKETSVILWAFCMYCIFLTLFVAMYNTLLIAFFLTVITALSGRNYLLKLERKNSIL